MKKHLNSQGIWLAVFLFTNLFTSCNKDSNLVGPGKPPVWTQEQLQSLQVRGVCATGNVIIVGGYPMNTSYGYFFRSTDNGATWVMTDSFGVNNTSPGLNFVIYPSFTFLVDGADILAGVGGGMNRGDIYRSTDGGMTWSDKGISWPESGDADAKNINSFCSTGENIFAGTFHGVFRSTDRGATWKAANAGLTWPIEGLASTGSSLFACTEGEGIFLSDDGGTSWRITDTSNYIFVSLAAIRNEVFAGAFQFYERPLTGGAFLSTDYGVTWVHSDSGLTNHAVNVLISSGTDLYAGTNSGVFFSANDGGTWMFDSAGSASGSTDVIALAVNGSRIIEGTLQGVWVQPLPVSNDVITERNRVGLTGKGG